MKKVIFNNWIPIERKKEGNIQATVKGTGCFETGFKNEGLFHAWSLDYEDLEFGVGNYAIALVELPDGTIEKVQPEQLKFINQ